ncbi:hypothetical protein PPERSA_07742 [Pseudocohnilembus persalinus]|uniref:JmjC domain-containing protein n=1 Tax=Pseudocohnilembus persalinus TaxID=266149 RepID=A0A0V0R9P8_PSEPJ|nr:hypothetical protein PPERSA_07742 [Pseudocohnilembus persalinus]|eukprot:KRX11217.1 hypothetical protein PPERSA_07742 [Pseudocohnilembus persalinus]
MYKQSHIEKYWSFEQLYDRYKEGMFKCGEDDDGHKLKIRFKYYLEYLVYNKDDSPLYLFESSIEDNKDARPMIKYYDVPKFFTEDFFQYVGESKRPPYRWCLLGPERSGTTIHLDPLNTDAWNTSFQGYKKWVLFPNEIPKAICKGKQYKPKGEDDEAINYFAKILPQIIANEGRENLKIQEFIQGPGETVYIPGGWWHAVINVTDTVAVTQNVMTSSNLSKVWRSTRVERKRFACYCLKRIRNKNPDLASRLEKINQEDGFVMWDQEKKLMDKKRSQNNDLSRFNEDEIKQLDLIKKKRKYSSDSSGSSSSSSSSDYDSRSSESSSTDSSTD